MPNQNTIKEFYSGYADNIFDRCVNSPYPIRRHVHRVNWDTILKNVKSGENVLEVGCGEGVLSVAMALKGAHVTATDISLPNIEKTKENADENGVLGMNFVQADAENLPFGDNYFDIVIADNILEHLPDFEKGLSEIKRVTKSRAIIALPTGLNLCAWCLLGGDNYWKVTRKTPFALLIGFMRFVYHIFGEGVNEGYAGRKDLPHLWRYPWIMKKQLKKAGFEIIEFEASSLCFPYLNFLLPLVKWLEKFKHKPIINNFGFGSVAYLKKV